MAEPIGDNAGLDSRLRDALGQAAQQGDSAGVADAIRSRVAAGDPGASASGPVAPGWARRFGMLLGGLILGVVIVGGTATGVGFAVTSSGEEEPSAAPSALADPPPSETSTASPTPTPSATPTVLPSEAPAPAPAPVPAPAPPADTTPPTCRRRRARPCCTR